MEFPAAKEVESADRETPARWYRHLVPTANLDDLGKSQEQRKILNRIGERFREMGGMTPQPSKKIGF